MWTEKIPKRDNGFRRGIDCRTVGVGIGGAGGRITEWGRFANWE